MRTAVAALLGFALGTLGCSPKSDHASDVGSVGVALQVAPGLSLDAVSYAITGPGGFARMGTLDMHSIRRGSIPCGAFF
jgi:hypothetical protein